MFYRVIKRCIVALVAALALAPTAGAQQDSFDALRADYPQLMERFGDELSQQRADYIFAIDVSGTMYKYKETVVPALQAFFASLQEGDYVSVIKFGAEATNDVGSAGRIGGETLTNLNNYAAHLFDKPSSTLERQRFFNNTDLDNMLHYLADDMKQIGRNDLKFVFIITDFVHDPSAPRRGHEDWDGVGRRLALEQAGNSVFVFALQLPGSGRDLPRVQSVFPESFRFNHVGIAGGNALSDWFTQRKNAILLDKFRALVAGKIEPAELKASADVDINGVVKLHVRWNPNPLYDALRIDTLTLREPHFALRSLLPRTIGESTTVKAGRLRNNDIDWKRPRMRRLDDTLTLLCSYNVPYLDELAHLGIEAPTLTTTASLKGNIFSYIVRFETFVAILVLLAIYAILVVRAIRRNRSDFARINGRFEVTKDGDAMTPRKAARAEECVDFGRGASWMPVPECQWTLRIYVVRHNALLRPLKGPEYRVQLTRGSAFKAIGGKWGAHQTPAVPRYTTVTVDDCRVKWMQ